MGLQSEEGWKLNMQAALDCGFISEEIPLDQVYTNEFVRDDIDYSKVEAFMDSIDVETISSRYAAE